MNNIVWFSAGYVFETERKRFQSWNNKIILAVMAVFSILEIMNIIQYPYFLLKRGTAMHKFVSVILCSSLTYMLSVLCSRFFSKASDSKIWDVIVRNSFYVYIFHDPLEYIGIEDFYERRLSDFWVWVYRVFSLKDSNNLYHKYIVR